MNTKLWNILCWNIRGINSEKKWNAIRDRLSDHVCDVICLQETKHSHFDLSFIHKFCPPIFDRFDYLPAVGASGGSIIIWKSTSLSGTRVFQNDYATSVQFTSLHNNVTGCSQMYMLHVLLLVNETSFPGLRILQCQDMWIG
jgi:hypothetical protein